MWRHGAGDKILQIGQQLGITVNAAAARKIVDLMTTQYKQDIKDWKKTTAEVRYMHVQPIAKITEPNLGAFISRLFPVYFSSLLKINSVQNGFYSEEGTQIMKKQFWK